MRLQLKTRAGLLVAVGLALASPAARAERPPITTSLDTFFYTDTDNVMVISPQVGARADLDDDGSHVAARAIVDVVSAASVDVVSEATPRFSEVRSEASLSAAYAFGAWLPSLHYRFSSEPDYLSNGGGAGLEHRLGHDTTLRLGYDLTVDQVLRSGTDADVFSERLVTHSGDVSVSQVIDPRSVVRVAASWIGQFGYLEKPYRYVPLFDAAGLAAAEAEGGLSLDNFGRFRLAERPAENVPDTRLRYALAVRGLRYLPAIAGSLRLDYRLYADDWGMTAHTGELALRKAWGRHELAVSDRVHWQGSVDFWRRTYVVADDQRPIYRSVDKELSRLLSDTVEVGWTSRYAHWSWYARGGFMYTRFLDYLFLDSRVALTTEVGVRLEL